MQLKHLKIGFVGILSSFALLLSMFTFTGTASAHSVTSLRDDPHISVDSVNRLNRVCLLVGISGWGFHENSDDHADLVAFTDDGRVDVFPSRVAINGAGRFFVRTVMCDRFFDERCFTNRFFAERCIFERLGFVFARDEQTGERSNTAVFLFTFPRPF